MDRIWNGRLHPGSTTEHESFVSWLDSEAGRSLLARSQLDGYRLLAAGDRLTVILSATEPPAIIHFLRNPRFWPPCWEFTSAGAEQAVGAEAVEQIVWRKRTGA